MSHEVYVRLNVPNGPWKSDRRTTEFEITLRGEENNPVDREINIKRILEKIKKELEAVYGT